MMKKRIRKKRSGLEPIRDKSLRMGLGSPHIPLAIKKKFMRRKKRSGGGRVMTGTEVVQILGGYK